MSETKISQTQGGFMGALQDNDNFGIGACNLGDIDGDGVTDIAVGAYLADDGGTERGAVWVLRLNSNGTVKAHQKISSLSGGLVGTLDDMDRFGVGVAGLGDLDGDNIPDLAVGAYFDDDGGTNRGAVWILFLNGDGTVKAEQKISSTAGGFSGPLDNDNGFGIGLGRVGDLDGDGVVDLAVGALTDDDGGAERGAVWILFLNTNGTVKTQQKISDTSGGFMAALDDFDRFGRSVAGIGDLDGDSVPDVAVGANLDDDGNDDSGAVYVLFMNTNGTVKAEQKISSLSGGFAGNINNDLFGGSIAAVGDVDGDRISDLAVGAPLNEDGAAGKGAVWILMMRADGTVRSQQKISDLVGNFDGELSGSDFFGTSLAAIGDFDADCYPDFAAGAFRDDDGGIDRGAVWIVSLDGCLPRDVCCPGNADGLGGVNFADITSVLTNFGIAGVRCTQNPGDANCDGSVNFADITDVLTNFGMSCP